MTSLNTLEGRIEYIKTRNRKIGSLRASATELDINLVNECIRTVIDEYVKNSTIQYMANIIKEETINNYRFKAIRLNIIIDRNKYLAPDYEWGIFFSDIGRAIARGENKHLNRRISNVAVDSEMIISCENPDFNIINKGIQILLEKNIKPDVMLLPIELYVNFVKKFRDKLDWKRKEHPTQLDLEGCKINVFWSNKYSPLKNVFILNANSGKWHVLGDEGSNKNITVAIGKSEKDNKKVEIFTETLVYYHITNKNAFIKINLSEMD